MLLIRNLILSMLLLCANHAIAQISHNHKPFIYNDYIPTVSADDYLNALIQKQKIEARNRAILEQKLQFDKYYRTRNIPVHFQSVTFFSSFPDYGNLIEIWIDGEFHSWISNGYFKNGSGCNSNSERAVYRFYGESGVHKLVAISNNNLRWEFNFVVEFDRCKEIGLNK